MKFSAMRTPIYNNERRSKIMKQKTDKGVAGLTILLSLIVMLFIIGLIVMIFSLMGSELKGSTTDPTAIQVINDTYQSISGVTDWFDIFIVIGAMVVLILLTVVIITAIRSSGMVSEGGA
jgi:multisubunit Na+/H+ antiporter MnhB subunit